MIQLHICTKEKVDQLINRRQGETKLGECLEYCLGLNHISTKSSQFVLFGIQEAIGVQANYGKTGTQKAWDVFLNAFVNIQNNRYCNGSSVLLLGHISVSPTDAITATTTKEDLGEIVSRIDKMVSQIVKIIVEAGKIPIIIGGGHNNAYGNIKGLSEGLNKPINTLNIDAHTDLRSTDFRHSGNGFSFAIKDGFLNKYAVFGLHKNYTPEYIYTYMNAHTDYITYANFEDISDTSIALEFSTYISFVKSTEFGLEVDCDAISNFPSSAQTPCGFSLNQIRVMVRMAGKSPNCNYLHVCEAAPSKENSGQVGKALVYLVTDFIQSKNGDS